VGNARRGRGEHAVHLPACSAVCTSTSLSFGGHLPGTGARPSGQGRARALCRRRRSRGTVDGGRRGRTGGRGQGGARGWAGFLSPGGIVAAVSAVERHTSAPPNYLSTLLINKINPSH
jgi:hypothetical protein